MSLEEWAWVGVGLLIMIIVIPSPFDAAVGVLVGALISGLISWQFYQQASDDQKDIHAQTASMLQSISGGHKITVDRDEQGNTTVTHHIEITNVLDTTDSVEVDTQGDQGRSSGG